MNRMEEIKKSLGWSHDLEKRMHARDNKVAITQVFKRRGYSYGRVHGKNFAS